MFRLIIFLALLTTTMSADLMDRFYSWAEANKIELPYGDNELMRVFANWKRNDEIIEETNAKNLTYTLGHNAYSGLSAVEFAERITAFTGSAAGESRAGAVSKIEIVPRPVAAARRTARAGEEAHRVVIKREIPAAQRSGRGIREQGHAQGIRPFQKNR